MGEGQGLTEPRARSSGPVLLQLRGSAAGSCCLCQAFLRRECWAVWSFGLKGTAGAPVRWSQRILFSSSDFLLGALLVSKIECQNVKEPIYHCSPPRTDGRRPRSHGTFAVCFLCPFYTLHTVLLTASHCVILYLSIKVSVFPFKTLSLHPQVWQWIQKARGIAVVWLQMSKLPLADFFCLFV